MDRLDIRELAKKLRGAWFFTSSPSVRSPTPRPKTWPPRLSRWRIF